MSWLDGPQVDGPKLGGIKLDAKSDRPLVYLLTMDAEDILESLQELPPRHRGAYLDGLQELIDRERAKDKKYWRALAQQRARLASDMRTA